MTERALPDRRQPQSLGDAFQARAFVLRMAPSFTVADLRAALAAILRDEWQLIETAPRDGTRILAVTGDIADERWSNLSRREFVIWHLGRSGRVDLDLGWSLYPGMGVGDEWLAAWQPLPTPPEDTQP